MQARGGLREHVRLGQALDGVQELEPRREVDPIGKDVEDADLETGRGQRFAGSQGSSRRCAGAHRCSSARSAARRAARGRRRGRRRRQTRRGRPAAGRPESAGRRTCSAISRGQLLGAAQHARGRACRRRPPSTGRVSPPPSARPWRSSRWPPPRRRIAHQRRDHQRVEQLVHRVEAAQHLLGHGIDGVQLLGREPGELAASRPCRRPRRSPAR